MAATRGGPPLVAAWCGRCGYAFDLGQVVAAGTAGDCPRCGEPLAGEYAATAVQAARRALEAVAALVEAGSTLQATAPHLHVDAAALADTLARAFGGSGS